MADNAFLAIFNSAPTVVPALVYYCDITDRTVAHATYSHDETLLKQWFLFHFPTEAARAGIQKDNTDPRHCKPAEQEKSYAELLVGAAIQKKAPTADEKRAVGDYMKNKMAANTHTAVGQMSTLYFQNWYHGMSGQMASRIVERAYELSGASIHGTEQGRAGTINTREDLIKHIDTASVQFGAAIQQAHNNINEWMKDHLMEALTETNVKIITYYVRIVFPNTLNEQIQLHIQSAYDKMRTHKAHPYMDEYWNEVYDKTLEAVKETCVAAKVQVKEVVHVVQVDRQNPNYKGGNYDPDHAGKQQQQQMQQQSKKKVVGTKRQRNEDEEEQGEEAKSLPSKYSGTQAEIALQKKMGIDPSKNPKGGRK